MHTRRISRWPPSGRAIAVTVGVAGLSLLLCCILCVVLVAPYARYEMTHDLPNPYWGIFNRGYSYTPEQGPPDAVLLDTRPDVIAMQYLHDYLASAGTYPCVEDLHSYKEDETVDPVLHGEPCTVSRPVTDMHVLVVRVSKPGIPGFLKVDVEYLIDYADGTHLQGFLPGIADIEHSEQYFFTEIHVKCWELSNAIGFYDNHHVVSPPGGAEYFTADGKAHCAGVY